MFNTPHIHLTQGWDFVHRFSERITCFLRKNEQMSDSLQKTSGDSLIRSFLVSDFDLIIYSFVHTVRYSTLNILDVMRFLLIVSLLIKSQPKPRVLDTECCYCSMDSRPELGLFFTQNVVNFMLLFELLSFLMNCNVIICIAILQTAVAIFPRC